MYGSNKNKIIDKLRRGYTPIEITPSQELSSTFKNIFKPLIKKKDLDFFFELYDRNEANLKAWSFLGIYHILKEQPRIDEDNKKKLSSLVLNLLSDNSEITYYGGAVETQATLRAHHVRRLAELKDSLIFEPVLEYCKSFEANPDNVIMELIEQILSHSSNKSIEDLIIYFSKLIKADEIEKKIPIVKSFGNLGRNVALQRKREVTKLFKEYLDDLKVQNIDDIDTDQFKNDLPKKRELKELIFKVGALLDLELEEETLEFVESLEYPYDSLDIIAGKYKNNEKFKSLLLEKLQESTNPHFIVEVLKALIVLREELSDWKNIIIDNIIKYQIIDGDLISSMEKTELISEEMMISFLNKADDWSLKFLREYLIQYPDSLNEWEDLKNSLIGALRSYKSLKQSLNDDTQEDKVIKFIFSMIIDLELKGFLIHSFETFKRLETENLRKMAIFPILKFGEESLLLELKEYMKDNQENARFIRQFLDRLERNDWRFYY